MSIVLLDSLLTAINVPHAPRELSAQLMQYHAHNAQLIHSLDLEQVVVQTVPMVQPLIP
jgi:hypothetical protein